jgi:hypothetical protein
MGNKYIGVFELNSDFAQTCDHGLQAFFAIQTRIYDHAPISVPNDIGIEVF